VDSGLPHVSSVLPRNAVHERRDAPGRQSKGGRAFDRVLTATEESAQSTDALRAGESAPDAGVPLDEEPGRIVDVKA
jgi:hypothetical protein